MRFSKRTSWPTALNPLAEAAASREIKIADIVDLAESNPTRCFFDSIGPEILKPLAEPANLSYEPDPRGLKEARGAVCHYYARKNIQVDPGHIFLTASTSEAYAFILKILSDPGDKVLIPEPSYPLFEYLCALADVESGHYFNSYQEGAWKIDSASIGRAITAKTQAIILVNPNNPTGNFISPAEREAINRFASLAQVAIIADEVFLDFNYESDSPARSFADNDAALTFTLGGVSKSLGLPQMKLAWMVVSGPRSAAQEAIRRLEIVADTFLSVNTPSQCALPFWLGRSEDIRKEMLDRFTTNRAQLAAAVRDREGVELLHAEGGWYAILKIDAATTDEDLAIHLLTKHRLQVQPGYFYDLSENHLVLSLLPPPWVFEEGLRRLTAGLKTLQF